MEKIKVIIVADSEETRYEIKSKLYYQDIALVGFSKLGISAVDKILGLMPNVVLIAVNQENSIAAEVAERIYVALPACSVMFLCENPNITMIEKAMQAGARKVLGLPVNEKELIENIRMSYNLEKARNLNNGSKVLNWHSRVITVFGTKGGVGKTMMAANLAVSLSRMGRKTALIDLDLQFGDLNVLFDLDPKDTIIELVQGGTSFDIDTIKSCMLLHSSGVSVLCAPKTPEYSELVKAEHIERLINTLRPYYEYIVVDTSPVFNDAILIAIENSNLVVMVATLDIPTLRNTKTGLNILESLQQKDKVHMLINRELDSIITVKDAEQILNMPIKYKISGDFKTAVMAVNKGIPIVIDAPHSTLAKELGHVAGEIVANMDKENR